MADPIFVYDLLGGRDGTAACATRETPPASAPHSDLGAAFGVGVLVGVVACLAAQRLRLGGRSAAASPPAEAMI